MKSIVRFTKQAKLDLTVIWETIASDNIVYADKMIDKLKARTLQLEQFPKLGVSRPDIDTNFRQLVEGRYLILYEWIETESVIEIVTVIHGARDLQSIL
jgi:toxin ParE1/3/4